MRLTDQTWPDTAAVAPVVGVPVGSCEQHGPHLPLGTDTVIAEALVGRLAARRPAIAVGPSLAVTASGEHAEFAGTLSVGTEVVVAMIVELVRSAGWADGVVLVNGHGGNREAVDRAVATLHGERRPVLAWSPSLAGADAHAGRTETSIMLALRPDLVREDRAVVGETAPLPALMGRLRAGGVAVVDRSGVLGDPTGASAAEGESILRRLTDDLVAAFDRWNAGR